MSAVGVKGKTYAPLPPPDASLCSCKSFANDAARLFAAPSLAKGYGLPEQLIQEGLMIDRSTKGAGGGYRADFGKR